MKRILFIAALALSLTACGPSGSPVTDAASAPAAHSGGDNSALWGIGGFLLGNALANRQAAPAMVAPAPAQHITVNKTVVVNKTVQKPKAPASRWGSTSSSSRSSFRSSPSFGRRR